MPITVQKKYRKERRCREKKKDRKKNQKYRYNIDKADKEE